MTKQSEQIVIYPRGFAGYDIGLPVRIIKPTQTQLFNSIIRNSNITRNNKVVISNTEVEKLWKQLTNGDKFINNFNFREQILKNALIAFGTNNFLEWVNLQSNNPFLGSNHIRFINDTLNFIEGNNRALNIQMWLTLLTSKEESVNETVTVNLNKYFNVNKPLHLRKSTDIKYVLIKWLSIPGGFEDLLGTMHVLFGDSDIL